MENKIRLLIADDHVVVRRGLVLVLRQEPEFEVVGEARDGIEAVRYCCELMPDLVILDWKMPKMDGLQAASQIRQTVPSVRTLLLSGAPIESAALDALSHGVDGFVLKDISPNNLRHAINIVAKGETYLCSEVSQALIKYSRLSRQSAKKPRHKLLTKREKEVLALMVNPLTYRKIGELLSITEETVRSHAKHILAKLGQPNRTQAVIEGLRLGLISLEVGE